MKCQDTYKEVKILHHHNGITKVLIPDLTEEERARRMKRIHDAAADLLRCKERVDAERRRKAQEEAASMDPTDPSLQEAG